MSNTTATVTVERRTRESELAKIDTRFYWFRGPWGEHEAIVVDTETGHEYELMTRGHLTAPLYKSEPVTEEMIHQFVQERLIERRFNGDAMRTKSSGPAGTFSRQCFNRGLGYNPIVLN